MSVESVKNFFIERGLDDPVVELMESGATVDLAAKTIGVDAAQIAKTLAFILKDRVILIVMRGDARIDNKKFKQHFKIKAKMLEHNEVEEITSHPIGGLCPFGLKTSLDIYLDKSIQDFEYVYPAAGSQFAAMKIKPEQMRELTQGQWVDVCQVVV